MSTDKTDEEVFNEFKKNFEGTLHNVTAYIAKPIDEYPHQGNIISFQSHGMFPQCDGKIYIVRDDYLNHKGIKNIEEIDIDGNRSGHVTQVIVHTTTGFNDYLYKMADNLKQFIGK